MKRPTESHRTVLVVVFAEWRVVVGDHRRFFFLRTRPRAACDQECRDQGGEQDDPEHEAIDEAGRAEHHRGRPHQRVADDSAKSGR